MSGVLSDRTFIPHSFHPSCGEHLRREGTNHILICGSIPRSTYGQHEIELVNHKKKKKMTCNLSGMGMGVSLRRVREKSWSEYDKNACVKL